MEWTNIQSLGYLCRRCLWPAQPFLQLLNEDNESNCREERKKEAFLLDKDNMKLRVLPLRELLLITYQGNTLNVISLLNTAPHN